MNDLHSKEFNDFVAVQLDGKAKSNLAVYKSRYKVFTKRFPKQNIRDVADNLLIDVICEATQHNEFPANTRAGLLMLVLLLKRFYNIPHKELQLFRIENDLQVTIQTQARKKSQQKEVGKYSIDDLKTHMLDVYNKKDYTAYIINYLLINFGVRNQDLNVILTADKSVMNDENNYLFVKNGSVVEYIRQHYKTHKHYGNKTFAIKDKRFMTAVKKLLANGTNYLLHKKNGDPIDDTSLFHRIQTYTLDGLGEADVFKIVIAEYDSNVEMLEHYEASRGTKIKTIVENYAVNK